MGQDRARVAAALVLTGLAAGVVSGVLTWALRALQELAWGSDGELLPDVAAAPGWRVVLVPVLSGALLGLVWWRLRRTREVVSVHHALANGEPMDARRSMVDALAQIALVGCGASLGREGAPREAAAALADRLWRGLRLDEAWRAPLLAAAAGAGLAGVYNVPLAGVVFALEVVGRRTRRTALAAVVASPLATVVAWPVVGRRPTYRFDATVPGVDAGTLAVLVLVAVAGLVLGSVMTNLSGWARTHSVRRGAGLPLAMAAAGALLGLVCLRHPELAGNGKDLVQQVFDAPSGIVLLLALGAAKLVLTSVHLLSGASGGLLTPALAVGACGGAAIALALGRGELVAVAALVGAAIVLAIGQRSAWFAAVFCVELTAAPLPVGAFVLACCLVTWWARCQWLRLGSDHDRDH